MDEKIAEAIWNTRELFNKLCTEVDSCSECVFLSWCSPKRWARQQQEDIND